MKRGKQLTIVLLVFVITLSTSFVSAGLVDWIKNIFLGPEDNLIAFYKFENDVRDIIQDHHGIIKGNPQFVEGKSGKALSFDGVDDFVEIWNSNGLSLEKFTISSWVKASNTPKTSEYSQWISKNSNYVFSWDHLNPSLKQSIAFYDGSVWRNSKIKSNLLANTWYHIAASYNGTDLKIYLNGKLEDSNSFRNPIFNTKNLTIGSGENPSLTAFKGVVDEVKIWNRDLTENEIKAEFENVPSDGDGGGTIDICSQLNDEVKNKVRELEKFETVIKKEGDPIHYHNYVLIRNNSGVRILNLVDVENVSYTFSSDKIDFVDINGIFKYRTLMISGGSGVLLLDGNEMQVKYSGADTDAAEDYVVTINWGQIDEINDYSNCFVDMCGDGIINNNEVCDKTSLNGKTCRDFQYDDGAISCCISCEKFDLSQCKKVVSEKSCTDHDINSTNQYYSASEVTASFEGYEYGPGCTDAIASGVGSNSNGAGALDTCYSDGNTLLERICNVDKSIGSIEFKCPGGCKDGKCVEEEKVCIDSDGGIDYFIKGSISDRISGWGMFEDYCLNSSNLIERHCLGSDTNFTISYDCPKSCQNGACLKEEIPSNNQDDCLKNPDTYWDQETNKCYGGYNAEIIKGLCKDPDNGKNYDEQAHTYGFRRISTAIDQNKDSRIRTSGKDSCLPNGRLIEYYCDSGGYITSIEHDCQNGCEVGVCIPNKETITLKSPGQIVSAINTKIRENNLPYTKISADSILRSRGDWRSGKDIPETETLDKVCEILGYSFVKSHSCNTPPYDCNFHTPDNNFLWRFNGNDFVKESASPKYGKSRLNSITCEGKLPIDKTSECIACFDCTIEPIVCPSSGIQNGICIDTCCNEPVTKVEIKCNPGDCSGCFINDRCLPLGYRTELNGNNVYCHINDELEQQKTIDSQGNWAKCQNNFECESNVCSSGECIEIAETIRKAKGFKSLVIKILCKLAHLFSIEEYNQCILEKL